jgi:RND family efflux transporter MFP subunit
MLSRRTASVFLVILAGCSERTLPVEKAAAKPKPVAVAKAEPLDRGDELTLAAEFRPYLEADLHAKIAGYLKTIQVDLGSEVKTGDVLATLEAPELDRELEQAAAVEKRVEIEVGRAKADLERAQSVLSLRELSFERFQAVLQRKPGLVAQQEIDEASSKMEEAKAQVAAARANLAASNQQIEIAQATRARINTMRGYTRITAPFAGVVTRRYADPGAMIQAGTASQSQARPVVRLAAIDRLRLSVAVPATAVPNIHTGQTVQVRIAVLGRQFPGQISRFSSTLDVATRTMNVEIDVPNPDQRLKPGMFADVVFPTSQTSTLTVPIQSIVDRNGPAVMAVNKSGVVEERRVTKGLETADRVEILAGLQLGDLVVTVGANQVRPGETVTPRLVGGTAR